MLDVTREWQLQDAKAQLSALVERAATEGPQRITRHGRPAAVLVSERDFQRLNARRNGNVAEFLSGLPFGELELERDAADTGREIDL